MALNTFWVFLGIYLTAFLPLYAQYRYTETAEKAYLAILDFQQTEALHHIEHLSKDAIGWKLLLENYVDVLPILLTENKQLLEQKEKKQAERLALAEKLPTDSPYYLFLQAEIRAQWAMVHLKFGHQWTAFYEFSKAYHLLVKNQKLYPNFVPNAKTLGLFQIFIGSIPEKYKWIVNRLGLHGSVTEGFTLLEEASHSKEWCRIEARLLYAFSQAYLMGNTQEAYLWLDQTTLQTATEKVTYALLIAKANKAQKAYQQLQQFPSVWAEQIPFLYYLKGDVLLQIGKYDSAGYWLEYFTTKTRGQNYIKAAYFKLFLCQWFQNQPDTLKYRNKALQHGALLTEPDKYAMEFCQASTLPDKYITQARLFTDGGEYAKALKILAHVVPSKLSPQNLTEYYYRYARIYHAQKDYDKALEMYQKTVMHGKHLPVYFAANADLQTGFLYAEVQKDTLRAEKHFKRTLSYKKHEYKNSLDTKAENALNKLKTTSK